MTHAELSQAGVEVSAEAYAKLRAFLDALLQETRKLNLTAIRAADRAWPLHIVDSLALLPLLRAHEIATVLDLGSGGGLPGLPLACAAPNTQFTLLDATRKKLLAAERMIETVGLTNVATLWGRAELLARAADHRERYDVVVARAVAKLPALIEYAAGFVRVGGQCWFMKSAEAAPVEVELAENAARLCALKCEGYTDYDLPGDHGRRVVIVYTKASKLRAKLPRAPGAAKRGPL
jgi:16S rRNA (guanine527-N7)-methyltransferase